MASLNQSRPKNEKSALPPPPTDEGLPPRPSSKNGNRPSGGDEDTGTMLLPSQKKIVPRLTITDNPSEVFSVRWSPDGKYLAAGSGDGSLRVFHAATGRVAFELQTGSAAALPATALRFRPAMTSSRTKNVLAAANCVGALEHWHMTSGKCLHSVEEEGNHIFCIDYRPDGEALATAGKDCTIRLYDEATKSLTAEMKGGAGGFSSYGNITASAGHSNRIFSVKYHVTDPHVVISGGWDNTIQIWDTRVNHSVRSIFGPHIAGDSLDMKDTGSGNCTILSGSWRPTNPLELWDYGTGRLINQVNWKDSLLARQPCLLYAAQFSKGRSAGRFIAAGGSGANEARVFERTDAGETLAVGTVANMNRGVFSIDWSPVADKFAIGGGDGTILICDVMKSRPDEETTAFGRGGIIDAASNVTSSVSASPQPPATTAATTAAAAPPAKKNPSGSSTKPRNNKSKK